MFNTVETSDQDPEQDIEMILTLNCVRRFLIKKLVSKKKRRYKADGYNLDLTYLTNKVITMGFLSKSIESIWLDEVQLFLEDNQENHYKVCNLYSERFSAERRVQFIFEI